MKIKFRSYTRWSDGHLREPMADEGIKDYPLIVGKTYEASKELLEDMLKSGLNAVVVEGTYIWNGKVINV